jgi:hypothetical protein
MSLKYWSLALLVLLVIVLAAPVDLLADRRRSGGSVRQSRNVSHNVNRNVNRSNVNVNRTNVNVNRGYGAGPRRGGTVVHGEEGTVAVGRRGAVAVGEEGAAAVGRRGAVVKGEEGFVGVGRYGGVVAGGEIYEDHEGWKVAAGIAGGVAAGIAIGTMVSRPPAQSTTVVVSGSNYMYSDGAYYEQVMYGGQVQYRVVTAPAGAMITTLPGGCTTIMRGGASYTQCGATYYQRVNTGYRVVVF